MLPSPPPPQSGAMAAAGGGNLSRSVCGPRSCVAKSYSAPLVVVSFAGIWLLSTWLIVCSVDHVTQPPPPVSSQLLPRCVLFCFRQAGRGAEGVTVL